MNQSLESYMVKSPYVGDIEGTLKEAYEFMVECGIRHLPIVDEGELIGMVSERDLKEALGLPQSDQLKLADVMKKDVFVAQKSAPLKEIVKVMQERKIGSTVIVNKDREVIGIFTTTDALGILVDLLESDEEESQTLYVDDYFERWDLEEGLS